MKSKKAGILKNQTNMEIFIFGSNLAGIHGAGAAKYAVKHHGAIYGQGVGLQGSSYAIPTKDENIRTLPLETINKYVTDFIIFAIDHPEMTFMVSAIGCGLAGLRPEDIAPMFSSVPNNVKLPKMFLEVLYDEIDESRMSFTF